MRRSVSARAVAVVAALIGLAAAWIAVTAVRLLLLVL